MGHSPPARAVEYLARTLRLEIAPDAMEARIFPIEGRMRSGISVGDLVLYLHKKGIHYGILEDEVAAFLAAWKRHRVEAPWMVARGMPPVPPRGGGYCRLPPPTRTGGDPIQLLPLFAKSGDPLFERRGRRHGTAGRDVTGNPIDGALEDLPSDLRAGAGIDVTNGTWTATRTGFLSVHDGAVTVGSTLIHRRELPVAHYRWDHNAEITGDILPGTQLDIGGDLWVSGDIGENVTIHARGDVTILGHVHGNGDTRLEAGGRVSIRSITHANVLATGDVVVEEACTAALVQTRGCFLCDGRAAQVLGGKIEAVCGASVARVGSVADTPAHIACGFAGWVQDGAVAIEEEIRDWLAYGLRQAALFEARYQRLLADRALIYKLPDAERAVFDGERQALIAEQARIDERVAKLMSEKGRLLDKRTTDRDATIRVGHATTGCQFSLGGDTFVIEQASLGPLVFARSPTTRRILPIPASIFDSAMLKAPGQSASA